MEREASAERVDRETVAIQVRLKPDPTY